MSFIIPGEVILAQLDEVLVLQKVDTFDEYWHDLSYLNPAWQSKVTKTNLSHLEQFPCSIILTSYRLIIIQSPGQDILRYLAQDQLISINVAASVPLLHFQKVSKSQDVNSLIMELYYPCKICLKFQQKPIVEQCIQYLLRINDGRVHFSKFQIAAGVAYEQVKAKIALPPKDPLSQVPQPQASSQQQHGFKALQIKPQLRQFEIKNHLHFDHLLTISKATDDTFEQLMKLTAEPLKNDLLQQFRNAVEVALFVESQTELHQPLQKILPYYRIENTKQNINCPHITFRNYGYKVCPTYPSLVVIPLQDSLKVAPLFQLNRFPTTVGNRIMRSGKLVKPQYEVNEFVVRVSKCFREDKLVVFELGTSGFESSQQVVVVQSGLDLTQIQKAYEQLVELSHANPYQPFKMQLPPKPSVVESFDQLISDMTSYAQQQTKQKQQPNTYQLHVNKIVLLAQRIATCGHLCLLCGSLERFLGFIVLVCVDLFTQKIKSVQQFINSFRFHGLNYGLPIQSIYSPAPSKMLCQQHEFIASSCVMHLFEKCVTQVIMQNQGAFSFGPEFVHQFVADILSGRFSETCFDSEGERTASCVFSLNNCFQNAQEYEKFNGTSQGTVVTNECYSLGGM
ncbi:Myotubularin-like_phosphatase [Hexamita inflata]|uniref:Myotubularin-like phosphatase n=1 Tax=Hexamita inflata TaxID=28002 RepID=A0AA86NRI2_9EUKA|nr:Myotubularin-like phosphatase [Hexamita inflata]